MNHNTIILAGALMGALFTVPSVYGYEAAYEPTPVDAIELKALPAALAIAASSSRPYFERSDSVFMKLFRYIDARSIAMTTPVEVDVDESRMRFFVGDDDVEKATESTADVEPVLLPAREVVALGLRGGYSEERFQDGVARLRAWLSEQSEWVESGEPVAVYWDGPFKPGWFKRSEVHLPVERLFRNT